jgi:hypothetical protein
LDLPDKPKKGSCLFLNCLFCPKKAINPRALFNINVWILGTNH